MQDDYVNMNTGVMLMNPARLRETLPEFRAYIAQNLAALEKESWDEAAYRWFYRDSNGPLWDRLRPELNWKPILGRVCGGEDHPFPRTEAVSAGPYRIHLA